LLELFCSLTMQEHRKKMTKPMPCLRLVSNYI
jgi:hypothetical protein